MGSCSSKALQNVHNIARKQLMNKQIATQELDDTATQLDVDPIENPSSLIEIDVNKHQELNQTACYEAERGTEELSFGKRIVNISHFFKSLQEISSHGPLDCGLKSIEIVSERLTGLMNKLKLECSLCNMSFIIEGDNTPEDINYNIPRAKDTFVTN